MNGSIFETSLAEKILINFFFFLICTYEEFFILDNKQLTPEIEEIQTGK
jgi:hypothetical protein